MVRFKTIHLSFSNLPQSPQQKVPRRHDPDPIDRAYSNPRHAVARQLHHEQPKRSLQPAVWPDKHGDQAVAAHRHQSDLFDGSMLGQGSVRRGLVWHHQKRGWNGRTSCNQGNHLQHFSETFQSNFKQIFRHCTKAPTRSRSANSCKKPNS